jgi:hypothetical protein
MEGKSRKGRIEWERKGSVPLFFTLPLSFHSYTFLMDDVNAFGLRLHQTGIKSIQDGNLEPLYRVG